MIFKNDKLLVYEKCFAKWFNTGWAFSFWKARVALYAALKAMGIGPGDEVIIPGYTCVVDVNPVKYLGAKPIYVDIEPLTYNIDVNQLEAKITPRTKVIMAQHTYGYPCDLEPIMDLARQNNIKVVEDCCHAFGSTYKGELVGTFGDVAYFSTQWNKPFTTGIGGMLLVNDEELAKKVEAICSDEMVQPSLKEVVMLAAQLCVYRAFIYPRTTALAQTFFRYLTRKGLVIGSSSTNELKPVEMAPDFFKSISSLQASAGVRQLARVEKNIAHRRKLSALYDELITQKGWSIRSYDASVMDPVMVRYPIRITEKQKALTLAASKGIELGDWFECPLHAIDAPLETYGYTSGMCPIAEKASGEVVNLPTHPRVSEKTARKTVDFVTQFTSAE